MASPEEWFKSLPPVTKHYFVIAVGSTVLTSFGVFSPYLLFLDFNLIFYKFQIWRLITCFFFFGNFGLPFVFGVYILVKYFGLIETEYYQGPRGTADLLFICAFGGGVMILVAYFWEGLVILGPAMTFMILYVWSRKDPYRQVMMWGFAFQAWHFPFVLLVFAVIMGNSPVLDILGIAVGHLYYFLSDVVPRVYGYQILKTPEFLYRIFETNPAVRAAAARPWMRGQGHRLGE